MLIVNARLITNDKDNTLYDDGAVYIKGNVIEEVGTTAELKAKYSDDELFDAKGRVVMPGMICAHSHIYSTYARGMGVSEPTDNFYHVLENQWWRLDRLLTLEDVKLNGLTTFMESIQLGVTTLIDHHSGPNSVEGSLFALGDAAKETGMRASLCYEVSDRDGMDIRDKEIKENVDFIKACQKDDHGDMLKGLFGLHASFTLSDDTLNKSAEAMAGVYDGYHVHVAEGIEDEWDTIKTHGKRVVERFEDFGMITENTLAVHGVHVNEREMDILKHHNTPVIFNPESNMNNAVGCPPILRMLEKGITVGLGTDAYTNDMFESMKVANILLAHNACDPTKGFGETLQLQFKNNPKIVSRYFNRPLGVIEKGAYADIITLDYNPFTPVTANNWGGHSLFGFTGRLVNDSIINGDVVMKDKIITKVDQAEVHAKSSERVKAIWKCM
ncbi:putative aminohydrolase SsnA [Peptoniphilus equinus]|uniref:Aminohydrolase SsnA n=1 Tax=Peptoniphilus equinus TaxID=3016343 RepID=A0ABY7QWV5_9FIRM|nr:putative aminohydrolase SsnA [Peptoniphilus equinus]WBW50579.1 putative aminohydrolase SsnA [Peptoniphilus equinus]